MRDNPKTSAHTVAILVSFITMIIGSFTGWEWVSPMGFALLGLSLLVFRGQIAEERQRINKATNNELLKRTLFAKETIENNKAIIAVVGVAFLVLGSFISFTMLIAR